MFKDFCKDCEYQDKCKYFRQGYRFCENCVDSSNCELRWSAEICESYHEIECNNGYEEKVDEYSNL